MSRSRFELTFHRLKHAAKPEAFVFEPQPYRRHRGKAVIAEAIFPWSQDLLEQLSRLQHKASDAVTRRKVGATLRDFLAAVAWEIPEEELLRAPGEGDEKGNAPTLLTISAGAAELYALPWECTSSVTARCADRRTSGPRCSAGTTHRTPAIRARSTETDSAGCSIPTEAGCALSCSAPA